MSTRRFIAYFLAVSAGSTIAFASTLRGQSTPQGEAMSEVGMILTATDAGLDTLPPGAARLFREMRNHPRHKHALRTAQIALVR